jgi:hypothetical protein
MEAKASGRQLRAVAFDPPTVNDALLTRYFVHKLEGRRHLAEELSLLEGFNLLVAAYGVISVLARLRAAAQRRESVDEHDVAAAVQAADLLVVEHTTVYHKPMFAQLVRTILSQPTLCAAMLARLER